MRVEHLTESQPRLVELAEEDAEALSEAGRRLAAARQWWGASAKDRLASVVDLTRAGASTWRVTVPNAIGVISTPGVELVISPKIPLDHVLHLFSLSGRFPRLDRTAAQLAKAEDLWPLIATWYLGELELLIRSGLAHGYREQREESLVARGRVNPAATGRLLLRSRVALDCTFESFDADTPLNRTLRAAALAVARSRTLGFGLRRRARRAIDHLEGVGELQALDASVQPDRVTARYRVPLDLARHVLAGSGRTITAGDDRSWSFLIRTPEMVEEALRRIARGALAEHTHVEKQTLLLNGSAHSLTPDLHFGSAIGDVKYKVWSGEWDRTDLYQLVAFATGFSVEEGLRLGVAREPHEEARVEVGTVSLSCIDWVARLGTPPVEAEDRLRSDLVSWWRLRVQASTSMSGRGRTLVRAQVDPGSGNDLSALHVLGGNDGPA